MKMLSPDELIKSQTTAPTTENWWDIDGLPSKGLLYPAGTKIKGRPLKTLEVKKLATINSTNFDVIINEILQNAIMGIEVLDLLIADKMYLLFWLRANTYKDKGFMIDFACKECESPAKYEFSIDNIKTLEIKDDCVDGNEIELPISNEKIVMKYLLVKDEERVSNFKNKNSKSFKTFDDELLNISNNIHSINGVVQTSLLNVYDFVVNADPFDVGYMISYINHIEIGIGKTMDVVCNKYGGTTQTGVTFRPSFFIPTFTF